MTRILHITTTPEPSELHGGNEKTQFYGVSVALEVKGSDETSGKAHTYAFIKSVVSGKFHLFAIEDSNGDGTLDQAVHIPDSVTQVFNPTGAGLNPVEWLEKSGAAYRELVGKDDTSFRFYNTNTASGTANMRNATAFDLLRSAAKWPAPVAQEAGLVRAVSIPKNLMVTHDKLVLVYLPEVEGIDLGNVTFKSWGDTLNKDFGVLYIPWLDGETIQAKCTRLHPYKDTVGLSQNGAVKLPVLSETTRRMLHKIEEQAATTLWPATILGSLAGEDGFLASISDKTFSPAQLFHWIAQASVVSMFDIAIAGLLLSQSNSKDSVTRQSLVLQRLSRFVAARFEEDRYDLHVDEDALYLKLHKLLWAKLTTLEPITLWDSLKSGDDISLPLIEIALTAADGFLGVSADNWSSQLEALSVELSELASLLESETGAEAWLLGQFDGVVEALIEESKSDTSTPENEKNPAAIKAGYADFKEDINGPYNAAEALRQDFGAEVIAAIGANAGFENRFIAANPFYRRFADLSQPIAQPAQALDALFGVMVKAALPESKCLKANLEAAGKNRIEPMVGFEKVAKPFRPDSAPQPLHIPLANKVDPQYFDAIAENASGLGFLIHTDKDGPVSNANLIGLKYSGSANSYDIECTVDPTLPLFCGGMAGMSIAYNGAPLSSPNRIETVQDGLESENLAQAKAAKAIQPYHKLEAAKGSVPALAYGKHYGISAYWIPPSGVLPMPLRKEESGDPFKPEITLTDNPFEGDVKLVPYSRRTAISEIQLSEIAGAKLGQTPKGVHPLALDAPRIAIEGGGHRWRDIYRLSDGTGALAADTGEIVLHDVRLNGAKTGDISVTKMPTQDEAGATSQLEIENLKDGRLTIKNTGTSGPFWVRIKLMNKSPETSFSFDDPGHDRGQDSASHVAPHLLLAPGNTKNWIGSNTCEIKINAPGVSFEDFERWARNSKLWHETCGIKAELDPTDQFFTHLRSAHAVLHAIGSPLVEKMNQLPDPAVTGLYMGATPVNQTAGGAPPAAVGTFVPFTPYQFETFPILDIDELKSSENPEALVQTFLSQVFANATRTLKVSVISEGEIGLVENSGWTLNVPDGHLVQVWISPAVDKVHFSNSVFDERMKQLSVGENKTHILFDGPKFTVETMADINPELQKGGAFADKIKHILCPHTPGVNRSYTLDVCLDASMAIFSEATLLTQRWRHTGLPIYNWIAPAAGGNGPVIAINKIDNLNEFEADAFAGRDQTDGNYTRTRLLPGPLDTEVFAFDWPERSATYLRHTVVLHSRYGAAMKSGDKSLKQPNWGARIAILADLGVASLTRPQLRAHLPLQRKLKKGSVAPILAVLSEPPDSQLGLAERLEADIRTTNTYEIADETPAGKLQLDGLRKEIGPDPLLSYFPITDDHSRQCHLRPEGPIGLHFDSSNAKAPAWSNSQYLLHLELPEDIGPLLPSELEESFAGVSLSRRADPDWSWSPVKSDINREGMLDNWIEPNKKLDLIDSKGKVVCIEPTNDQNTNYTICVKRSALFQDGGNGMVEMWAGKLSAVLLKPLGDGRYKLSAYSRNERLDISGNGQIDRPQLVSSVLFNCSGAPALKGKDYRQRPTLQSDSTFLEWVRTTRDISELSDATGKQVEASALKPTLTEKGNSKLLIMDKPIMSPVSVRRYPLHVHRRLVYFIQRPSTQIGHEIPLFQNAYLADSTGCALVANHTDTGTVSIGELELRAEILGVNCPALTDYKSANFDLLSSRDDRKGIRQIRFHIRAINQSLPLKGLEITLSTPSDASIVLPVPVADDEKTRNCDLYLWQDTEASSLAAMLVYVNEQSGARTTVNIDPPARAQNLFEADSIQMQMAVDTPSEFWVDISALHSTRQFNPDSQDDFDFDWLFGVAQHEPITDALTPKRLNSLEDAQARLIGVGDPIEFN